MRLGIVLRVVTLDFGDPSPMPEVLARVRHSTDLFGSFM